MTGTARKPNGRHDAGTHQGRSISVATGQANRVVGHVLPHRRGDVGMARPGWTAAVGRRVTSDYSLPQASARHLPDENCWGLRENLRASW